jgi:hypothetical protein
MPEPTTEELKPLWVRPQRAAKLCDCSLSRLYQLMDDGTLRNAKIGGMRLVSFASIEQLGAASAK